MSLRVLLADESASIRKVFQMGLQDFGVEVKSVQNGLDVIQVAENYQPHIIFADILLQKKNGYEVSEEIHAHQQLKNVPVVLMWSSFMELDQKRFQNCGAQGELEKPFDVETMRTLIKNLVNYTHTQSLSGFLKFPESLKSEFVEEEKTLTAQRKMVQETAVPQAKTVEAPVFALDESQEPVLSLEDDVKVETEVEVSSIFNLQNEGEAFDMNELEILATPPAEHEPAIEIFGDENWEAKPLNDQTRKDAATSDDDLDGFQSMNLQVEQRLKLEDFLYRPDDGVTTPSITTHEDITAAKITNIRTENTSAPIHSQIRNVQIADSHEGYNKISPAEAEAIIRSETRNLIKKTIEAQLPKIIEQVVREELAKVLEQELAIKSANSAL